ncbi:MAG: major facilitator superfamily 1 [Solirubrobacterales bacterium]|jgi:hypothetical protein|nr:major facilitator superfamily 1 [Solirubrobacterales bacterium]
MTTSRSHQRWVLGLASLGSFIVVLDLLVVSTALSTIQRHLGASIESLEWTINTQVRPRGAVRGVDPQR